MNQLINLNRKGVIEPISPLTSLRNAQIILVLAVLVQFALELHHVVEHLSESVVPLSSRTLSIRRTQSRSVRVSSGHELSRQNDLQGSLF